MSRYLDLICQTCPALASINQDIAPSTKKVAPDETRQYTRKAQEIQGNYRVAHDRWRHLQAIWSAGNKAGPWRFPLRLVRHSLHRLPAFCASLNHESSGTWLISWFPVGFTAWALGNFKVHFSLSGLILICFSLRFLQG